MKRKGRRIQYQRFRHMLFNLAKYTQNNIKLIQSKQPLNAFAMDQQSHRLNRLQLVYWSVCAKEQVLQNERYIYSQCKRMTRWQDMRLAHRIYMRKERENDEKNILL